jgi:glutamyl/glutaminyl-tRNA synthetase
MFYKISQKHKAKEIKKMERKKITKEKILPCFCTHLLREMKPKKKKEEERFFPLKFKQKLEKKENKQRKEEGESNQVRFGREF